MPGQLDVAPMWRRVCAGLVDVVIWLVVVGPLMYLRWGDPTVAHGGERVKTVFDDSEQRSRWVSRVQIALRATRALTREAPTPGERLLGVRWADARTGGPVSLQRSIAYELLGGGLALATRRYSRPRVERFKAHSESVARQTEQLRITLAGDPAALEREIAALQRTNGAACWGALRPGCAIALINGASRLRSPLRQSLLERLAGVVVIRDRR